MRPSQEEDVSRTDSSHGSTSEDIDDSLPSLPPPATGQSDSDRVFSNDRQRVPLSRTTIWRMMREDRFPQSRRIGKVAKAWLENEIEDWIKNRAAGQE